MSLSVSNLHRAWAATQSLSATCSSLIGLSPLALLSPALGSHHDLPAAAATRPPAASRLFPARSRADTLMLDSSPARYSGCTSPVTYRPAQPQRSQFRETALPAPQHPWSEAMLRQHVCGWGNSLLASRRKAAASCARTREAGVLELADGGVQLVADRYQVRMRLVQQPIRPQQPLDLLLCTNLKGFRVYTLQMRRTAVSS
jgi:hypothetical protein